MLPATPLPPHAVAVERRDQPGHERAVADDVGHVVPAGRGVDGARDLAGELRMVHVKTGVDHRHDVRLEPPPDGRDRLAGADGVVGPGELDRRVPRGRAVSNGSAATAARVALDVGHARVVARSAATAAAPRGHGRGEHADRVEALGLGAEAAERARPPRPGRRACGRRRAARAGAAERAIRASSAPPRRRRRAGAPAAGAAPRRARRRAAAARGRRAAARARASLSRPGRAQQRAAPHRGDREHRSPHHGHGRDAR